MNIKNKWLIFLSLAIMTVACSKNDEDTADRNGTQSIEISSGNNPVNLASMEQGYVRIKVNAALAKTLSQAKVEKGMLMTKAEAVNQTISLIGITEIKRTFPDAGEFEARTKAEGLDLWYDVTFNKDMALTKAGLMVKIVDEKGEHFD